MFVLQTAKEGGLTMASAATVQGKDLKKGTPQRAVHLPVRHGADGAKVLSLSSSAPF